MTRRLLAEYLGSAFLAAVVAVGNVTIADGLFTYQDGPKAVPSRVTVNTLALRPRALRSGVDVDFKGAVGDVPLTVEGTVGSFEALLARTAPYPVDLKGQVAGQAFAIATRGSRFGSPGLFKLLANTDSARPRAASLIS